MTALLADATSQINGTPPLPSMCRACSAKQATAVVPALVQALAQSGPALQVLEWALLQELGG